MPPVRPVHVLSFSSEDPNHPASNLLRGDTFRKWKCKEPGERLAYVILQLEKAETITSLDIGNEHSAFVEVLVGRSGTSPQKFEVLLSQCAFMTPTDSRNSTNPNRVRMFGLDKLDKTVAAEKWDLVKFVCTQEFNTHVQFGLSFVNIIVTPDPNEKLKIGAFGIRAPLGEVEVTEPVRMGGLFAKRLQDKSGSSSPGNGQSTAAAAIRSASTSLANAAISSNVERVKELKKQKIIPSSDSKIVIASSPSTPNGSRSPEARNKSWYGSPSRTAEDNKIASSSTPARSTVHDSEGEDEGGDAADRGSSNETDSVKVTTPSRVSSKKKRKKTKPFSKLFEDVVFVMSGFVNPYRANLRRKAIEMGARCKPDWDSSCTHLICAFVNTPKFQEVRQSGHGKIVKKEWIEVAYATKRRPPWRRYCLDRNDKGDESEEEIYADLDEDEEMEIEDDMLNRQGSGDDDNEDIPRARSPPDTGSSGTGRKGPGAEGDSKEKRGGDDADEEEEAPKMPVSKKRRRAYQLNSSDEEETEGGGLNSKKASRDPAPGKKSLDENEKRSSAPTVQKKDKDDEDEDALSESYLVDTDVDDKESDGGSPSMLANYTGGTQDFLSGLVFSFHEVEEGSSKHQRSDIERIIGLHSGTIESSLTGRVEYVLTNAKEWIEDFSEALSENPNLTFVRWEWIVECEKKNEMILVDPFVILPN